jgi:hypothetical protein
MVQEQDWTEAYKELCVKIKADVPEIKHLDLWYEQIYFEEDEYPYPENCLYLDINIESTKTLGNNAQELECTIGFIHVFDTLSETYHTSTNQAIAFEFIATQKKLHKLLQGLSGTNFSPLDRVSNKSIPGAKKNGYLIVRNMMYKCIIIDYSATKEYNTHTITDIDISSTPAPVPPVWTDIYPDIPII